MYALKLIYNTVLAVVPVEECGAFAFSPRRKRKIDMIWASPPILCVKGACYMLCGGALFDVEDEKPVRGCLKTISNSTLS